MTAILIAERGLLATDGTAVGTVLLKAAQSEAPRFLPTGRMAVLGSRVIFVAQDRGYNQLWITDGTGAGTTLVAALPTSDLMEGSGAQILSLTSLGHRVMFAYNNGDNVTAPGTLWVTDGSPGGTQLLTDQTSLTGAASALLADGRLVFVGGGLYVTDGTLAGTAQLVPPSTAFQLNPNGTMARAGSLVLFPVVSGDGIAETKTNHLWATDGTAAGTRVVASFEGNAADGTLRFFTGFEGKAFF